MAVRTGLMHLVEADNGASLSQRALKGNYSAGLQKGECLSALVKPGLNAILCLHTPWSMYTEAAWSFQSKIHLHFHLTWRLILYRLPVQKSIAQPKASPFFFSQSTGLQSSLTWIERYGDERIGCTETIAVGERFLAWGWTCSRNALQARYRASLGRGEVANNIWVAISFLGNCCFPSEGLYEPSETKSVKHKVPAMQLLQLHYAFHTQYLVSRYQQCFCFNRKSPELQTQETIPPVASLPSCPVPTFTSEGNYFHTEPVLSCVSMPLPQPTLFITLAVKAKYEHTYEYMNK